MNNEQLIKDLKEISILRHSKWDPLGLMAVRSYVKERLSSLGQVEEHFFKEGSEEGVNYILKLPGEKTCLYQIFSRCNYDLLFQLQTVH